MKRSQSQAQPSLDCWLKKNDSALCSCRLHLLLDVLIVFNLNEMWVCTMGVANKKGGAVIKFRALLRTQNINNYIPASAPEEEQELVRLFNQAC